MHAFAYCVLMGDIGTQVRVLELVNLDAVEAPQEPVAQPAEAVAVAQG